jgi:transcriptional regulator with XRE-family HTH domain
VPKLSDFINSSIAAVFRAAASEEGLTQKNLSDMTGINMTRMQRLLSDKSAFDVEVVALLADAVKVSPAEIMERAEKRAHRKLVAAMSEAGATVTPISKGFTQEQADALSTEEIESSLIQAAYRDPEANTDEPENP